MTLDELDVLGPLAMFMVDPNSTTGLRYEGWCAHEDGKTREQNPFSTPRFKGCLAEGHWWEGWDAAAKRAASVDERAKRQDPEEGLGPKDASAVPAEERADAHPSTAES